MVGSVGNGEYITGQQRAAGWRVEALERLFLHSEQMVCLDLIDIRYWASIASSSDGTKLAAADSEFWMDIYIF